LRRALGCGETNVIDRYRAKRSHVDAKCMEILQSLTAQKFSAHFVTRCGLAFDQRDASSLASERDGGCTSCHSATDDENFVLQCGAPNSLVVYVKTEVLLLSNLIDGAENSLKRHSVRIVMQTERNSEADR
jgi:hypothetical protein